jgi:hypothetical protein
MFLILYIRYPIITFGIDNETSETVRKSKNLPVITFKKIVCNYKLPYGSLSDPER